MKQVNNTPIKFNSISELHQALGFAKPLHPLISLVDYGDIKANYSDLPKTILLNFYKISYKKALTGSIKYGQNYYDFAEGGLSFVSPNQVIGSSEEEKDYSGYTLLFHPDFIRNYPLETKIKSFGFFSYAANEALFLSEQEKQLIFSTFDHIRDELANRIDSFSQDVLVSHLEVLLNYGNRFYERQFITRKVINNDVLVRLERLLATYFEDKKALKQGLPTVEYLAYELHLSPRYLSDLLRSLTGQNTQQHIHERLIEKAKEYLSSTNLSINEIAFSLGFEYPQSFSKLFKNKVKVTPTAFRESLQ